MRYIAAFAAVFIFLAGITAVSAANADPTTVKYMIIMDAVDDSGNLFRAGANVTKGCSDSCSFSMPGFDLSQANFANFTIYYEDKDIYNAYFYSTENEFTQDTEDEIIVELINVIPPEDKTVCDATQCDKDCVICSDSKCHEPGFECKEAVAIERIVPNTADIGVTQLNILMRNIGTVDLKEIYTELSGDGISTTDITPIAILVSGDKDYIFLKINATKAGNIDLVIKLYVNGVLKDKTVGQITIIGQKPAETPADEGINVSQLSANLKNAKARYEDLSQEYEAKKSSGYVVDLLYDKIKETNDYINTAQNYIIDGDYKKANANINIAEENLNEISIRLENAKKQEKDFSDTFRNNVLYIGSIAAAVVSVFSAYGLFKSHINKQKLEELSKKIKLTKEKQELEEDKSKSKKRSSKKRKKSKKKEEEKPSE
jgi:hypothetical protein